MAHRKEWVTILKGVRPHFSRRYMLEPDNVYQGVPRPNHGLHHSLRQGFLALDICTIFRKGCYGWISKELKCYEGTYYYIQAVSSFQRSGRESEHSSLQRPDLVEHYNNKDKANYESWASTQFEHYNSSVMDEEDYSLIGRIIKAAHQLDLARIPHFCKERIYKRVKELLFVDFCNECVMRCVFEELWRRSEEYLRVTGDRRQGKKTYSHHFVDLYKEPEKMIDELMIAQTRLRNG